VDSIFSVNYVIPCVKTGFDAESGSLELELVRGQCKPLRISAFHMSCVGCTSIKRMASTGGKLQDSI
jgi:hypothetical protein